MSGSLDLPADLQNIYDREINVTISCLRDSDIDVWLGVEVSGHGARRNSVGRLRVAPWLQKAIAHFYPASTYATSLSPEVLAARGYAPVSPSAAARMPCGHLRRRMWRPIWRR
jgi:hypothetical protein